MSHFIDRRLNGKNKSMVNRQRFLRRYRNHIKKAVSDSVNKRSITDMERGEKISIPTRDTNEPVFGHGSGGQRNRVFPGNKEFVSGDRINRPRGGGGGGAGSGNASNQGEGVEDFSFYISKDEYLDYVFEDLALPNLVKKTLTAMEETTYRRAGFSSVGTPSNISVVRSMRSAQARRIALTAKSRRRLREKEEQLANLLEDKKPSDEPLIAKLKEEIQRLKDKIKAVPFLDTFDIRYHNLIKQPTPSTKAVMFCVMDVSGSMTQQIKDMAKRFYILLYLFLQRNYERTEIVFIRHHTNAKEVNEEEFFYSRETGGTIVSSALQLTKETITKRYSPSEWNIYVAQASDGDNWDDDSPQCSKLLADDIMPLVQYFAYIEITPNAHQALWFAYEKVAQAFPDTFAMQQIASAEDIYPVFRELFARNRVSEAS